MNRIILIGNGFDLAHSLDTSYSDFIDDFWKKRKEKVLNYYSKTVGYDMDYTDVFLDLRIPKGAVPILKNDFTDGYTWFKNLFGEKGISVEFSNYNIKATCKNTFLKEVTEKKYVKNWVDIEEEYHKYLLEIIKDESSSDTEKRDMAEKLNREISDITKALEGYLKEQVENIIHTHANQISDRIYSPFKLRDFTEKGADFIIEDEYQKIDKLRQLPDVNLRSAFRFREEEIHLLKSFNVGNFNKSYFKNQVLNEEGVSTYFTSMPEEILFLSFNYTNLEKKYYEYDFLKDKSERQKKEFCKLKRSIIHIHGEIENAENPIIFGYGDEICDEYKLIEEKNVGAYLENIKSIRYMDTDNYKKLLNFINSDNYQVFVMGHSCGITDRTLLSTLFEHNNCQSIKVFFHQKYNGGIPTRENDYGEVVKRISRNFSKKSVFREKVVNRQYCEPLL